MLKPSQRTALVLHLDEIQLLEEVGIADRGAIAGAIGIPATEFAGLWPTLPLEDEQVARRLGVTRRQVISLRRSARERLQRRMGPDFSLSA